MTLQRLIGLKSLGVMGAFILGIKAIGVEFISGGIVAV